MTYEEWEIIGLCYNCKQKASLYQGYESKLQTLYIVDDPYFCGENDRVVWTVKEWIEYGETNLKEYLSEDLQEGDSVKLYIVHKDGYKIMKYSPYYNLKATVILDSRAK